MPPQVEFYALSDKGPSRAANQDAWSKGSRNHFFILADGVGGKPAGGLAAKEAVTYLSRMLEEHTPLLMADTTRDEILPSIEYALQKTNEKIWQLGRENSTLAGLGTTLSALCFFRSECFFTNIGDSRIYRLRQHKLELLTQDDSLLFELVQFGLINAKEARIFPLRNVITKSLGATKTIECKWKNAPLSEGDLYLICCDGLSNSVADEEIFDILEQEPNLELAAKQLLNEALEQGSQDNITLLLVHILKV